MEITYDIVDMVLLKIKNDCRASKECGEHCRFYEEGKGCWLTRRIPEDWPIKMEGAEE